ncbi:Gfo/Idh/MocA family oxidoreductase [bacterium]|nr:Gfo/Idh/MocA family oxidoreductase [bacterium]MDC0308995.1 Gfo/Idh/MocA family oxidoreductase [bacterium]
MSQRYCVVGVGGHARSKLIPALLANDQQIVGLVSTQSSDLLPCGPVFDDIESAIVALPTDTVFIIATPPALHFEQVRSAVEEGRDVIVEKPAFVSAHDAREIASICQGQGTIVVEGLMHRHTALYRRFIEYWVTHRNQIDAMDAVFLIPEVPPGTFRQESTVGSSCLYDMGCYMISLLSDLQLPLADLRLVHVSQLGQGLEEINIFGVLDGVKISIKIGVAATYQNVIELRTRDDETTRFLPFFYGRPGERWITVGSHGTIKKEALAEGDAFQAMLVVPRSQWLADQTARSARMIAVATSLEALGHELLEFRQLHR